MTDALDDIEAFVREELAPDDPQTFVQESAQSLAFASLGATFGVYLTARELLASVCVDMMPFVDSPCTAAFASANKITLGLAVLTVALLVAAVWMDYRGDE